MTIACLMFDVRCLITASARTFFPSSLPEHICKLKCRLLTILCYFFSRYIIGIFEFHSIFDKSPARNTAVSRIKKGSKKPERVVIVFPAQLGTGEDYEELSAALKETVGLRAYTAPLTRLDWPVSE